MICSIGMIMSIIVSGSDLLGPTDTILCYLRSQPCLNYLNILSVCVCVCMLVCVHLHVIERDKKGGGGRGGGEKKSREKRLYSLDHIQKYIVPFPMGIAWEP